MAATLREGYGLDPRAARLRAAQIVAAALGWRIFEAYLIDAGGLGDVPLDDAAGRAGPVCAQAGRHPLALAARPPAAHPLNQQAAPVRTFGPGWLWHLA